MNRKIQKAVRLIAGIVVGYLLGVMIVPYIKVEILTLLHGKEFSGLEQQTNMLAESEYFKVFAFDKEYLAQVYYVEKIIRPEICLLLLKKTKNGNCTNGIQSGHFQDRQMILFGLFIHKSRVKTKLN